MNDKAYRSNKKIMLALVVIGWVIGIVVYAVLWVRDGEPNMVFFNTLVSVGMAFSVFTIIRNRRKVAEIRRAEQVEDAEPKDDESPN